ncbi:hypothetical protein JXB01_01795 [Candidatus Micrarchaeota archaeon]|nr:hypothetical protein [Candidatus Micrarchaeota archaeon]
MPLILEVILMDIPNIYKGNYLLLMLPPLILIFAALFSIFVTPGIQMGVDFRGGTLVSLTLNSPVDADQLRAELLQEGIDAEVQVYDTAVGYKAEVEVPQSDKIITADTYKDRFDPLLEEVAELEAISVQDSSVLPEYNQKKAELDDLSDSMFELAGVKNRSYQYKNLNHLNNAFLESYTKIYSDYRDSISNSLDKYTSYSSISIQSVSPRLSTHFLSIASQVVLFSALLSVVFVFIFFRTFVPSLAVLIGAFCDIVIALGSMAFFGIPFTLPSFAALLMLIGYSLDTDILLTMRMLKRKGDPRVKAYDSMKTGSTMSITGIVAFLALFILGSMTNISTYYEISSVALAGLIGDLFATWGINAVILLYFVEKRKGAD